MQRDKLCIEVIDEKMAEILREKTAAERLAIAHDMWLSAQKMITHIVRSSHTNWSHQQIQTEIARRLSHEPI